MGVIENMKELADLIKKAGDIELYRKIVESEGEVIGLTRENRRLNERVGQLEGLVALQKRMIFRAPFYFQDGDQTPYCPRCWEASKCAVHLLLISGSRWDCPNCKQMFLVRANA
jgi:hypothetical protein